MQKYASSQNMQKLRQIILTSIHNVLYYETDCKLTSVNVRVLEIARTSSNVFIMTGHVFYF